MHDTLSKEEQYEFIEALKDSSANVSDLVENLLSWSRMSSNKIDFKPISQSISILVSDVVSLLNQSAINKNIAILNNVPDDLFLTFDENMVSLVFRNLISNSIKFTPKGGEIIIRADVKQNPTAVNSFKEQCIVFSVSDNGVGMNQESVSNLFRIDINQSSRGTENETGTGLGLVLCKEFIDKHNGRIWAESEIGKGSTFSFTL